MEKLLLYLHNVKDSERQQNKTMSKRDILNFPMKKLKNAILL